MVAAGSGNLNSPDVILEALSPAIVQKLSKFLSISASYSGLLCDKTSEVGRVGVLLSVARAEMVGPRMLERSEYSVEFHESVVGGR